MNHTLGGLIKVGAAAGLAYAWWNGWLSKWLAGLGTNLTTPPAFRAPATTPSSAVPLPATLGPRPTIPGRGGA